MAKRTQLKGVKKQRLNSRGGHRRRSKSKKSVAEKRRLRLSTQDTLLNDNLHFQENLNRIEPNE